MLQVSIDFYDHSSPNYAWKIQGSHIVVIAKPKLQLVRLEVAESKLRGLLKNLKVCVGVPRVESNYVSIYKLQITTTVLCDMQFLERPSLKGGIFAKHISVKRPKNLKKMDGQNDT